MEGNKNRKVRTALFAAGMRVYELADAFGIAETTMSRFLRYEWPISLQEKVCECIESGKTKELRALMHDVRRAANVERSKQRGDDAVKRYANKIYRDVSEFELEMEEKRKEWL